MDTKSWMKMLLNFRCGLLVATAAVDMTLLRVIGSSQRV
uniref:Uncharacterized protein n=1 Tax=Ciceribacter selenitireducens ATCC BAA-1503 TaxID=1336235 RepID=A0A380TKW1_9HYPH|nr:unnamed protein product [Ciceribacter selenitireducens ATCC BAA-1503]